MKKLEPINSELFTLEVIQQDEMQKIIGGRANSEINSGKGSAPANGGDPNCTTTLTWESDDTATNEKQCWGRTGCDAPIAVIHYGNPFGNPANCSIAYPFGIGISDPISILFPKN